MFILIGWLIDWTKNFDSAFVLVGIMQLLSAVIYSCNKLVEYFEKKHGSERQVENQLLLRNRRSRSYVSISYA